MGLKGLWCIVILALGIFSSFGCSKAKPDVYLIGTLPPEPLPEPVPPPNSRVGLIGGSETVVVGADDVPPDTILSGGYKLTGRMSLMASDGSSNSSSPFKLRGTVGFQ